MIPRDFIGLGRILLAAWGLAALPGAFAAPPADVTMQVVNSEEYAEESLVSEIKLPDVASLKARENAAPGLDTANQVRRLGQDLGREHSTEARELGREARRVNPALPGRPDVPGTPDVPGKPDVPGIPDVPGRPDVPGTPDVPGRPDIPGKPNIPGHPDIPANPGVPRIPDVPANPGVPRIPDVPGNPIPGIPNVPGKPHIP